MFTTIRSKIILISISMLIALGIVLAFFSYGHLKNSKSLVIQSCYYNIAVFAQEINKEVIKIENNTKELALLGEEYARIKGKKDIVEIDIIKVFKNYKNTLGGGIWYKPYFITPLKKLFCIYAYRDKNNEIVIDDEFESENYNYPNQKWYTEITSDIKEDKEVVWSTPYFEKEGSKTIMITAGAGIYNNGKLVGISTADWEITNIVNQIQTMRPTKNSFALFADTKNDCIIVLTDPKLDGPSLMGKSVKNIPWYNEQLKQAEHIKYNNQIYIPYVKNLDNGMVFIVCVPENELFYFIIGHTILLFVVLMLINIAISTLLYIVLKSSIQKPIDKLINIANKISDGKLDEHFEIKNPEEFSKLAATFDKMTKDIKNITKERERIESELLIAQKIQTSSLPNIFPPYPKRHEFEISASMNAAKEVGGDFYDFYFIDENNLVFIIADVSGKGMPAALFMMTTKTLISDLIQTIKDPKQAIKKINQKICKANKEFMFVSALIGILNMENGEINFINCGHNPPLIKSNGNTQYIKMKSNIVLGLYDNIEFEIYKTKLNKNDLILFYTDGITEAMNDKDELYGENRLLSVFKNSENKVENVIQNIKEDVMNYSNNTPQSDDITMLSLRYFGKSETYKYKNEAKIEKYNEFLDFITNFCTGENLDNKISQKIELIGEEIYSNISNYAYPDKNGEIEVKITKKGNRIDLKFIDFGIQYNPLDKRDPDIDLPTNKRQIGGLGIYMVKNMANEISYNYENKNILNVVIFI